MTFGNGQHLQHALDVGTVCTELLRHRAGSCPDDPLLLFGKDQWTYAESWSQSRRFQQFLSQTLGLQPDGSKRVAIFLENRPETVFAWFGAQLAGAIPVVINCSHRGTLLEYQLNQSRADALVTDSQGLKLLTGPAGVRSEIVVVGDSVNLAEGSPKSRVTAWSNIPPIVETTTVPEECHRPAPGDLCTVIFTSGTTGRSKAVCIPQNMIARGAARIADAFGFRAGDVFHGWLPLYHVGGLLHTLMAMVVCGGAVALIPKFSLSRFWDEVHLYRCTAFAGLASTINLLWRAPETSTDSSNTLRVGLGMMCPPEILRGFERRFGVLILDSYGMTEVEPVSLPPGPQPLPPGSCGKANPDFEVSVFDEQDHHLEPNQIGEIVVRPKVAHQIMQGYENDAAATVLTWRNLWMHTGDVGRIDDDGYIYIEGRIKEIIRRRGENISPWEVETVLTSHPAIQDCAVVGIPAEMGEEEVKVVVVLASGYELNHEDIRQICAARLSTFMVPRYVEIRESLPLNQIGKVDKKVLRRVANKTCDFAARPSDRPVSDTQ